MNLMKSRRSGFSIQDIQDEMNRILEDAFGDLGIVESKQESKEAVWRPAIELNEMDGSYQIRAELPGVNKDNIDVEVGEESVSIRAETKQETEEKGKNVYRTEFKYGKFSRTIPLPSQIDNSKATADYKDGVLTLTLPKSEEEQKKVRKLSIGE